MAQSRKPRRVWTPLAAACFLAGALAGCGSGAEAGTEAQSQTPSASAGAESEQEQEMTAVEISEGCTVEVSADASVKPAVTVPDCQPPAKLFAQNVVDGSGTEAKTGDAVSVQYAGWSWSTRAQFDASWDRGAQPFDVTPLGSAPVIQGWNDGLLGAHVGDRRLLVIPPELGYGAAGAGGVIAPNETLVFVVDVVAVNGQS